MERLTRRLNNNKIVAIKGDSCNYSANSFDCQLSEGRKRLKTALEKLADYEDLEEQGLLLRLPCSIGTTVWDIYGMGIRKNVVTGIEYGKDGRWFLWANEDEWIGELNVAVFLTREEAEKKLEELKHE